MGKRRKPTRSYQPSLLHQAARIGVFMEVQANHPLLVLKRALDWPAIRACLIKYLGAGGCNVDHGPGRPLDVDLYVPLIVLMLVKHLNSRQMEELLAENAVARVFIDWDQESRMQVRDHSNIARTIEALGEEGLKELNALIVQQAVSLGFGDPSVLSADTTAQELPVGHPHEAGILKGIGERCVRALGRLRQKGKRKVKGVQQKFQQVIRKAKEYHLFAKTKQDKQQILRSMMRQMRIALRDAETLTERFTHTSDRVVRSAVAQLEKMVGVGERLLPQIEYWLRTGFVAKGKVIHAGIAEARAVVRNKVGKKVEFGLQYLLCAIGGGYLFGELLLKATGEASMPGKALTAYHHVLGAEQDPKLMVYDRGGWSKQNVHDLKRAGVDKVGIQPKGRAHWRVHGTDRDKVLSERGQMEGRIGTLKTEKYGFNKPKERKSGTIRSAGQKSIISYNMNKLIRDLVRTRPMVAAAA